MIPFLNVATGWLLFTSLALVTGVVIGRWTVLQPRPGELPHVERLRRLAGRLGCRAASALGVSLGLVFLRQILEFRDPFVPWMDDVGLLLGGTPWGAVWALATVAALVLAVGFGGTSRGHTGLWWPVTVLALGLGTFPALTGHASAGDLRPLTIVADTLHVWAMGGWIGGLGLVVWLDHHQRRGELEEDPSILPYLVSRFSPVAMVCVAALVATGLFASWAHLDGVGALFSTYYGRLLLLKVALAGAVLALGAWNLKRLTPRLGEPAGREAMRTSATLEFLVANAVLVVTAILVRTSPM